MSYCVVCWTETPEGEDFCSDNCMWLYDEMLQIQRQEAPNDER